jgi:hypothetical protein
MTVAQMVEQARRLTHQEQIELLKRLVDLVAQPSSIQKTRSILEFEGVATHLADEEDPQEYLKRLRSEWDERP